MAGPAFEDTGRQFGCPVQYLRMPHEAFITRHVPLQADHLANALESPQVLVHLGKRIEHGKPGREFGRAVIEAYTELKSVCISH
ncbi:hypothetical protein [Pseudomonas sp. BN515]|uniref:hypothetical protein n=1 Tax=Pseudomonas sp. BN515 TaxID=2567892 RepID=UPI002455733E|nr:hypothetical protein [Pseudomonas sp. BN515]